MNKKMFAIFKLLERARNRFFKYFIRSNFVLLCLYLAVIPNFIQRSFLFDNIEAKLSFFQFSIFNSFILNIHSILCSMKIQKYVPDGTKCVPTSTNIFKI